MRNLTLCTITLLALAASACSATDARQANAAPDAAPPAADSVPAGDASPAANAAPRRSADARPRRNTAATATPTNSPRKNTDEHGMVASRRASFEEHQVPAGLWLSVELRTSIGSDTSAVEDEIRGRLTRPLVVNDVEVVPEGATVLGTVTDVERSGRVKGLARVAFRFNVLEHPETGSRVSIRTAPIVREAEPTKKKDAATIGGAAAGGAVIGAILGGGDGAAKGAAVGGAAGTGVVLGTRGKEVEVPAGTVVSARLGESFLVRIPAQAR
ncbi:MAG TPA: hypothetical protein VD833_09135 [Vicinamibacterales bacterium]|nr:hypothetical protein [Vicinamibacterales bacterium]